MPRSGGCTFLPSAAKLLMLAISFSGSSCITANVLNARPLTHVAALDKAGENDLGELFVVVHYSDGHRWFVKIVVDAVDGYAGEVAYQHDKSIPSHWEFHPSEDGLTIRLSGDVAQKHFGGDVVVIVEKPAAVSIKDVNGRRIGRVADYSIGYNWTHPGTWALIALVPLSATVDVLFLPIECVYFVMFPKAHLPY